MVNRKKKQTGSVLLVVLVSVFAATTLILGGVSIWLYGRNQQISSDVDSQIKIKVNEAVTAKQNEMQEKFANENLRTVDQYKGPTDLGGVSLSYPRDWSVYVNTDLNSGNNNKYEVYFNPGEVPKVSDRQQFALRVTIENKDYDTVMDGYQSKINNGDLTSSSESANGKQGTRLAGNFSQDIRGYAVVYKIRDKTLTVRTDAEDFKAAFDQIAQTINFQD